MQDEFSRAVHKVASENRENMELSGIKTVDAFNEEEVYASCDWGDIIIKGSSLHIEILDLETGILKVSGKISALVYNEPSAAKSMFRRFFRQ